MVLNELSDEQNKCPTKTVGPNNFIRHSKGENNNYIFNLAFNLEKEYLTFADYVET